MKLRLGLYERLSESDCDKGFLLRWISSHSSTGRSVRSLIRHGRKIEHVLNIEVDPEELVKRLSGRRVCKVCGTLSLAFNQPKVEGKCDKDNGELYQREDDNPETVKNRLEVNMTQTAPHLAFYNDKNVLANIKGQQDIKDVFKELDAVLQGSAQ